MPVPTVITAPTHAEIVGKVHDIIVSCQNDAIYKHGNFNLAISGPKLTKVLASALLGRPEVQWAKMKIYFADESLVPFSHPESNYGALKRELLDKLQVQPRVYTINEKLVKAGAPAQEVADRYAEELDRSLHTYPVFVNPGTGESRLVPKFDLIFLECAADGNVGAFFQGHSVLKETNSSVVGLDNAPQGPLGRITLTKPVFEAASQIGVVALEEDKKLVLNDIFTTRNHALPAYQINAVSRSSVHWFVNQQAVNGVVGGRYV